MCSLEINGRAGEKPAAWVCSYSNTF
uniref:Uncharacterized protein n=1 Tax=Anguilla anguilla TaxID=7936 RepID=A0A0E9PF51_ANGAN